MVRYVNFINRKIGSGISKKIDFQINAIRKIGYEVKEYTFYNRKNILRRMLTRIIFVSINQKFFINDIEDDDVIYIRYNFSDRNFIKSLQKLKNKHVKIIMEIPTYPYNKELVWWLRIKDNYYRRGLYRYINKIITFSDDLKIFNIPTISISNGIDVDEYKIKECCNNDKRKIFTIISVSSLEDWHGYDRVIMGIKNICNKIDVRFNIVGRGPEEKRLKKLVEKFKLSKNIIFNGYKDGAELDELFNQSDVAISCVALHRKSNIKVTSLKNREYCCRGIPFVDCADDKDFPNDFSYRYKIESSEADIDIEKLINFFESLKDKDPTYSISMNKFACNNLGWDKRMKKIFSEI